MQTILPKTIGHHTCKQDGGKEHVFEEAPFPSKVGKRLPYLGSGYYFWDNNEKQAHWWGQKHYQGKYYILVAELAFPQKFVLDLAGSREDLNFIQELAAITKRRLKEAENWGLAQFIEYFKLGRHYKLDYIEKFFEYKVIKAKEVKKSREQTSIKFVHRTSGVLDLDPLFFYCLMRPDTLKYIKKTDVLEPEQKKESWKDLKKN
ncbi:MAG: hypothetical protein ACQESN_10965 [Thermotogota bacterium]